MAEAFRPSSHSEDFTGTAFQVRMRAIKNDITRGIGDEDLPYTLLWQVPTNALRTVLRAPSHLFAAVLGGDSLYRIRERRGPFDATFTATRNVLAEKGFIRKVGAAADISDGLLEDSLGLLNLSPSVIEKVDGGQSMTRTSLRNTLTRRFNQKMSA